jgi:hypothetical protein
MEKKDEVERLRQAFARPAERRRRGVWRVMRRVGTIFGVLWLILPSRRMRRKDWKA